MMQQRPISQALFHHSSKFLAGGVNSPGRAFRAVGIPPIVVERGLADQLIDRDGNVYIDYCHGWGALMHGHAHPYIVEGAKSRIEQGSAFGLLTEVEVQLAEAIQRHLPSMERMRFVSTGTEATMSALRLARGCTGRETIVKFAGHYHGHADCLLRDAGSGVAHLKSSSAGVPLEFIQKTLLLPFNDFAAVDALFEAHGKQVAALIVEPVAGNMGVVPPLPGFLAHLRRRTEEVGALLIFDEVITGFRVGLQGAQGLYGVWPDLTCLGKVMGGGMPVAAFGGSLALMEQLAPQGAVYQAGTYSGNPVAMEAGRRAIELLERPRFFEELEAKCRLLIDPVEQLIRQEELPVVLQRVGSLFSLFFGVKTVRDFQESRQSDAQLFRQFYQQLFEKGILLSPSPFEAHFVSGAHTEEHLRFTSEAIIEALLTCYSRSHAGSVL